MGKMTIKEAKDATNAFFGFITLIGVITTILGAFTLTFNIFFGGLICLIIAYFFGR